MKVLEKEIDHFDNEEFKELLSKRNTFIHNLRKEYLSVNTLKKGDLSNFIQRLWILTEKYIDVFSGLVSISAKLIGKGSIRNDGIEKVRLMLMNI